MGFISPIATDANGNERQTGSLQNLGKDDFLQLLVTKLQYQDPLEPMQDEDFVAQLAQFSSLEQMNNIAEGIGLSNEWDYLQMQSLNNVMASGLIGKEATAEYSSIYFDGAEKATINFTLSSSVTEAEFVIKDASGEIVAKISQANLTAGSHSVKWDGTDSYGNTVDPGLYTVEASGTSAAGSNISPSLSLIGIVEQVIYRDGSAYLKIEGSEIPLGDITAVGEVGSLSGESDTDADGPEQV